MTLWPGRDHHVVLVITINCLPRPTCCLCCRCNCIDHDQECGGSWSTMAPWAGDPVKTWRQACPLNFSLAKWQDPYMKYKTSLEQQRLVTWHSVDSFLGFGCILDYSETLKRRRHWTIISICALIVHIQCVEALPGGNRRQQIMWPVFCRHESFSLQCQSTCLTVRLHSQSILRTHWQRSRTSRFKESLRRPQRS